MARRRRHVLLDNYSPDGKHLASGSHDKMVRVWDTASGRVIVQLGT